MARVQISIDDKVLEKVDKFAESIGLTRSAFMGMASLEYITSREKAPVITGVLSGFASLLDAKVNGQITDEELSSALDDLSKKASGIGSK